MNTQTHTHTKSFVKVLKCKNVFLILHYSEYLRVLDCLDKTFDITKSRALGTSDVCFFAVFFP